MKAKRSMRQSTSPKQKQKLTLVYAAAGMAIAAAVGVGIFFYLNLGNSKDSTAASADYYSIKSGFWADNIWNNGVAPTNGIKENIEVFKYVTRAGNLAYENRTNKSAKKLIVTDTLVVEGNLTMGDNTGIEIGPTGVLVVTGDVKLNNRFSLTNNGVFAIGRDAVVGNPNALTFAGNSRDLYLLGKAYAGNGKSNEIPASYYAGVVKGANNLETEHPPIYNYLRGGAGTLPIKLSYFRATVQDKKVAVSWATDIEENNDYFTVERSADGKHFEQIATVAGAGNSASKLAYSHNDHAPLTGNAYYRLKQTDYDGRYTYSSIQAVVYQSTDVSTEVLTIEMVAPNPFMDNFFMSYYLPTDGPVEVRLMDMQGIVVFSETVSGLEGQNQYQFNDKKGIKTGTYLLSVTQNHITSKVTRLIKR